MKIKETFIVTEEHVYYKLHKTLNPDGSKIMWFLEKDGELIECGTQEATYLLYKMEEL